MQQGLMASTFNAADRLDLVEAGSGETRAPARSAPAALLNLILLFAAAFLLALHFVHLAADFPNFSRWMDWSKYTDEGWYGDAAIRHFLLGHWYVAGDFNPAVALPVWPVLEGILFSFTGVSLVAARALTVCVFAGILLASWLLIQRAQQPGRLAEKAAAGVAGTPLAATVAVLLLAANPFCFVFTRLAILEPLLVLLTLLALLVAQRAGGSSSQSPGRHLGVVLSLGVLLPLLILTKTTGLFLVPAVLWMLFASLGYRLRPFLQTAASAAAIGLALWSAYFVLCVRPHYLVDYHYLFSANAYTKITAATFFSVLASTVQDAKWFGLPLFLCAIACMLFTLVLALLRRPLLRPHPLIPSLILWAVGYTAFLAYHDNLQPRYYLVVAVPLTLLVPVTFRDLLLPLLSGVSSRRAAYLLSAAVVAGIVLADSLQTLAIVRHPQYTLLSAAKQIREAIATDSRQHPEHSQLLLSISGSDLSLMTGLHSICDDFGTSELADRVKRYKPGWYAAWDLIEDDKMDALAPQFTVTRFKTFPAMDDADRNLLVLYRLEAAGEESEPRSRRGRGFRNRVGQQPSNSQLKH